MKSLEKKFGVLRRRLDDMGYRQILPIEAVPLVERLLNDLLQTTESFMRSKDKSEHLEKNIILMEASIAPYQEENGRLAQENTRLHRRLMKVEEKFNENLLASKLENRKLRQKLDEMKFLVEGYENHMRDLEERESGVREEFSKHFASVAKGKSKSFVMQRIDLPLLLDPNTNVELPRPATPDPYVVDMVKVCDARIAQLESRLSKSETSRQDAENEAENMKAKVNLREKEIERLEGIVSSGKAFAEVAEKAQVKDRNAVTRQMSLHVEYLEKTVQDLQKRLEDALEKQHDAMQKAVEEADKRKLLEKEVKQLDRLSFRADKDRAKQIQSAHEKVSEVEEECRKKQDTVQQLKASIEELKSTKAGLQKDIRDICDEKKDLMKLMETLQRDRDRLMEKINQLTENEKDLLAELNRLVSRSHEGTSGLRKGYMFETGSSANGSSDVDLEEDWNRRRLHSKSRSEKSVLKSKAHKSESLEAVSRLKREVMSLRHENVQLQSERDRLRRLFGYPGSGVGGSISPPPPPVPGPPLAGFGGANGYDFGAGAATGTSAMGEMKTKPRGRTSPGEAAPVDGQPPAYRTTTRHPFSGFTVTTNIEVSKSGRCIPVSTLTTTIPAGGPPLRTQAVGGECAVVSGGASSTRPSVSPVTDTNMNQQTTSYQSNQNRYSPPQPVSNAPSNGQGHGHGQSNQNRYSPPQPVSNTSSNGQGHAGAFQGHDHGQGQFQGHRSASFPDFNQAPRVREPRPPVSIGAALDEGSNNVTVGQRSSSDVRLGASSQDMSTGFQMGQQPETDASTGLQTGRNYADPLPKTVSWLNHVDRQSSHDTQNLARLRADLDEAKSLVKALKDELAVCQRERDSLRQEKFDLKLLNDSLTSDLERMKKANERLEQDNRVQYKIASESGPPSVATQAHIKRLEREKQNLNADIAALRLDRDRLRERLRVATETAKADKAHSQNQIEALKLKLVSLEREQGNFVSRDASQKSLTNSLRDQIMALQRDLTNAKGELSQQRAAANQYKLMSDDKERRIEKLEIDAISWQRQLGAAEKKLAHFADENGKLRAEVQNMQGQLARARSAIETLDREKDSLQNQVDERAEMLAQGQSDRGQLLEKIRELQSVLATTQNKLDQALAECDSRQVEVNSFKRQMQQLQQELDASTQARHGSYQENKRLQGDLTTAVTDIRSLKADLEQCRRENEDIRNQMQDYVNEVKRTEELLSIKEDERNELLEQYKSLTVEANSLEVEKTRLESTSQNLKMLLVAKESELDSTKGTLDALDKELRDQRASKLSVTVQLADVKAKLEQAERELKQASSEKASLDGDLTAVRDLCTQLDLAKEQLTQQLNGLEKDKMRMANRVTELEATLDQVRNEAQNHKKEVEYYEQQLNSRRDIELDTHRHQRDLTDELESLQTELASMKTKLEMKSADLDHYRKEANDLQVELDQLRLDLNRARSEKRELCDELERVRRRIGGPSAFLATGPVAMSPMDRSPVSTFGYSPGPVPPPQIDSLDDDFVIKSTVTISREDDEDVLQLGGRDDSL